MHYLVAVPLWFIWLICALLVMFLVHEAIRKPSTVLRHGIFDTIAFGLMFSYVVALPICLLFL